MGLIPGLGRFPWRREWQPTPVFLPGKFHGQGAWWARWSCKESDTTEHGTHTHTHTHTQRGSRKMTLFLAANAKLVKETAEPKLVTSVLPGGSKWSGRRQSGLKALVPYSCLCMGTAPLESRVDGGGKEIIHLMVSGQTML